MKEFQARLDSMSSCMEQNQTHTQARMDTMMAILERNQVQSQDRFNTLEQAMADLTTKLTKLFETPSDLGGKTQGFHSAGTPSLNPYQIPLTAVPPRSVHLECPRFDGSDAMQWIFNAEQFFDFYGLTEVYRLKIAAINFDGPVVPWFQELQKSETPLTWSVLAKAIESTFVPSDFDCPGAETQVIVDTWPIPKTTGDALELFEEMPDRDQANEEVVEAIVTSDEPKSENFHQTTPDGIEEIDINVINLPNSLPREGVVQENFEIAKLTNENEHLKSIIDDLRKKTLDAEFATVRHQIEVLDDRIEDTVQLVGAVLDFDSWNQTVYAGMDSSTCHDLYVIASREYVSGMLSRNCELKSEAVNPKHIGTKLRTEETTGDDYIVIVDVAEFATVRYQLKVLEVRLHEMVALVYSGDGHFDSKWKSWAVGDDIGCCIKLASNAISFYRNEVAPGVDFDGILKIGPGLGYFPAVSFPLANSTSMVILQAGIASGISEVGCEDVESLEGGKQICGYAYRSGADVDVSVSHVLIYFSCKCFRIQIAHRLFYSVLVKNLVSWTTMIERYAMQEDLSEGFIWFKKMRLESLHPSFFSSVSLLGESAKSLAVELGVDDAKRVFDEMTERDLMVWNAMIFGYAQIGQGVEAVKLFYQLCISRLKSTDFTFVPLVATSSNLTSFFLGSQFHAQILKGVKFDPHVTNVLLAVVMSSLIVYCREEKWGQFGKGDLIMFDMSSIESTYSIADFLAVMVLFGEGPDQIFDSYLYFHLASIKEEFHSDACHKIIALVLFLDNGFINITRRIDTEWQNIKPEFGGIEKWALRIAIDNEEKPYIPKHIHYRQKEQFCYVETMTLDGETNLKLQQLFEELQLQYYIDELLKLTTTSTLHTMAALLCFFLAMVQKSKVVMDSINTYHIALICLYFASEGDVQDAAYDFKSGLRSVQGGGRSSARDTFWESCSWTLRARSLLREG